MYFNTIHIYLYLFLGHEYTVLVLMTFKDLNIDLITNNCRWLHPTRGTLREAPYERCPLHKFIISSVFCVNLMWLVLNTLLPLINQFVGYVLFWGFPSTVCGIRCWADVEPMLILCVCGMLGMSGMWSSQHLWVIVSDTQIVFILGKISVC